MKRFFVRLLICLSLCLTGVAMAKPLNVIFVSSGPFARYQVILENTAYGLKKLGLIDHAPKAFNVEGISSEPVWDWLSKHAGGKKLRFMSDGFYSYDWDATKREVLRSEILRRIKEKNDVDLILTVGSAAGFDMAHHVDRIPVLSLGSSDPVLNKIVKSATDSGKDNVHALVLDDFYRWQVQRFHSVFHFKKLGLLIAEGRETQSGLMETKAICKELKIDFEKAIYPVGTGTDDSDYEKMKAALESLIAKGVDAVYLPEFACPNDRYPELMSIMTSRGIPSFSQVGEEPVSRGVLLGVGAEDMRSYGLFEAKVIDKVIKGVSPRRIGQIYAQNHGMVLNLKTAMEMGWKPPLDMLMTVEKTFTTHRPQVR
jgi:ABC-type uncharacterized transport system substrate-binding protein